MTPQGRRFTHAEAERLSRLERLVVICGRYEGRRRARGRVARHRRDLDRRLRADRRRAAGAGGARRGGAAGARRGRRRRRRWRRIRSCGGLLDHPHYTRPAVFRGLAVPDVLLSGHHAEIERWRRRERRATDAGTAAGFDRRGAALDATTSARERRASLAKRDADRRRAVMKAIETVEQPHLTEAAGDAVRRHGARAREGARRRQGAHPGVRGHGHRHAPRRHARDRSPCARCRSARASSASSRCTRRRSTRSRSCAAPRSAARSSTSCAI